jgi:hypothetical protein
VIACLNIDRAIVATGPSPNVATERGTGFGSRSRQAAEGKSSLPGGRSEPSAIGSTDAVAIG